MRVRNTWLVNPRNARDWHWPRRNACAWRGLRQKGLIESERRKISVFANRNFRSADFVGPFDVSDAVAVHRLFGGEIFLEIVIRAGSDRDHIAVLRSCS